MSIATPLDIAAVIPQTLRDTPHWIHWRPEMRGGKPTKVPYIAAAVSKDRAATNKPKTWAKFERAHELWKIQAIQGGRASMGFVFASDDPFCGIDLDSCLDPSGVLAPWAVEILDSLKDVAYAEVSPSKTGIKLFVRASVKRGFNRKVDPITGEPLTKQAKHATGKQAGIEIYSERRYFAVTGERYSDFAEPGDAQEIIDKLVAKYAPKRAASADASATARRRSCGKMTDAERARRYLAKLPASIDGQNGHTTLFEAAAVLRVGFNLDASTSLDILREFNERCQPPWDDRDLVRKNEEGAKANREPGYLLNAAPAQSCTSFENTGFDAYIFGNVGFDSSSEGVLHSDCEDIATISPKAWQAIADKNNPPTLFSFGGNPNRLQFGQNGEPLLRCLDVDRLRHHSARANCWVKTGRKGEFVPSAPSVALIRDMLAAPENPLPPLSRIVESPVFASTGEIITTPGYHAASQTYFAAAPGLDIPQVNTSPTVIELQDAVELLKEWIGDFPFVSAADFANAMALILLPFARDLIDGPTPLHLVEKNCPGTGGTLLVEIIAYLFLGRPVDAISEGESEAEWRKRLTAALLAATPFIFIDNLKERLDSAALSSAITAKRYGDRKLGTSEQVSIPVRSVWIASGNNPGVSTEISRRVTSIRLDAKVDRPWLRTGFKHPKLHDWTRENRARLIHAALTVIRSWIAAGKPTGEKTLGMFDAWASVMGGILTTAGVPDFLENATRFYDQSDEEGAAWRAFVGIWWDERGVSECGVADLFPFAVKAELPLGDGNDQSQRVRFGKLLTRNRDRMYRLDDGVVKLVRGQQRKRAFMWRLQTVGAPVEAGECVSIGECFEQAHAHATHYAGAGAHTHAQAHAHEAPSETLTHTHHTHPLAYGGSAWD